MGAFIGDGGAAGRGRRRSTSSDRRAEGNPGDTGAGVGTVGSNQGASSGGGNTFRGGVEGGSKCADVGGGFKAPGGDEAGVKRLFLSCRVRW